MGPTVLWVYGVLMLVGGLMGYRAGSKASLIAGVGSGLLLGVAWLVSRTDLLAGLWLGAAISLVLCVSFSMRLLKTRKAMPAGALLAASLVALALLAYSATRVS